MNEQFVEFVALRMVIDGKPQHEVVAYLRGHFLDSELARFHLRVDELYEAISVEVHSRKMGGQPAEQVVWAAARIKELEAHVRELEGANMMRKGGARIAALEKWAKEATFELRAGPSAQRSRLIREGEDLLKGVVK